MERVVEVRPARRVVGSLWPPPSKSISQRYFLLALLGRCAVTIERPLVAEDTTHFLTALEDLGVRVEWTGQTLDLRPGPLPNSAELDCGCGGTMLRFLVAALTALPGQWTVGGSERLSRRPLGPLISALRALGATVRCTEVEGFAPLEIEGGSLSGGRAKVDARESSQYLSALLMAAFGARKETTLEIGGLSSRPYLDLTLDAIELFGGSVDRSSPDVLRVTPQTLQGGRLTVEGDWSAAAYPAAAAALIGGRVELAGLDIASRQGDRRLLDLLGEMGAEIRSVGDTVVVESDGCLHGLDVDMSDIPDQVPTIAALAPFAAGTTRIVNVPHLRFKESDRLEAMTTELRRVGATVEEQSAGLVIPGIWASSRPPSHPVEVASHQDHRIAMSMALLGLRRGGLSIRDPRVVAKSYPNFWRDLALVVQD